MPLCCCPHSCVCSFDLICRLQWSQPAFQKQLWHSLKGAELFVCLFLFSLSLFLLLLLPPCEVFGVFQNCWLLPVGRGVFYRGPHRSTSTMQPAGVCKRLASRGQPVSHHRIRGLGLGSCCQHVDLGLRSSQALGGFVRVHRSSRVHSEPTHSQDEPLVSGQVVFHVKLV